MMAKKQVFRDMLDEAIKDPGILSAAFKNFHNYSFGNVLNVAIQASIDDVKFGPMAPEKKWNELGRTKLEGSTKYWISVPVSGVCSNCKGTKINPDMKLGDITPDCPKCNGRGSFRRFKWVKCMLVLEQTEGDEYELKDPPGYSIDQCLQELKIELKDFDSGSGNAGGFSERFGNKIALNKLHPNQANILFHEIAHQLLHNDKKDYSRWEKEVEAESTAYICAKSLGIEGLDESRGYIQHWLKDEEITEEMSKRIFQTASAILKAGKED